LKIGMSHHSAAG